MADMGVLKDAGSTVYKYLNFDQVKDYTDVAESVN
jgi:aconitate hydratase 2/2-methylisocitrate dehydratase